MSIALTVVQCGKHALHLCHGKHSSEETVAGIVAARLIAKHSAAVVDAEGERPSPRSPVEGESLTIVRDLRAAFSPP